ncbi:MAG: DNA-3-methyladenine glycosylase|nr:DNA-3-methyladenine glycosylase [Candidatus Buchananbacteria bacterium]
MKNKLKRLNIDFFQKPTLKLAPALLGKYIIRQFKNQTLIGKISETEAYYGSHDLASHASKGKTKRTKLMFDQPGLAYIYLIYGMYYCFNIVTEKKDFPAAVLIRSVEPIEGLKTIHKNRKLPIVQSEKFPTRLTNGPGKFCQAFMIDKKLNGENLISSQKIYLAQNYQKTITSSQIKKTKRIGIDYAGSYKNKLWRYYLKDNPFISQK